MNKPSLSPIHLTPYGSNGHVLSQPGTFASRHEFKSPLISDDACDADSVDNRLLETAAPDS